MTHYFGLFSRAIEPDGSGSPEALKGRINAIEIDSYESGRATWTKDMEQEFLARRGYSLRPWMPVLTERIIGSAEQSERFLFDWRKTLGELMAECHYDAASDIFHPLGIQRFNESHEERTAFIGDGMAVKKRADVPMSAFWVRFRAGWYSSYPTSEADVRESSSVAHIYGQNICAAESFTTNGLPGKWDGFEAYRCNPGNLKRVGDAALACGLNRFVIHTSVHQPLDDVVPGLSLDRYGQWFNRHDTWAEEARPWMDYLARSSYMLRTGKWCADIAYFYGEDKNITGRFMHERPEIPAGWNYDFVNAEVLTDEFKVQDGLLMTETGMSYKVLRIDPEVRYMSMRVLQAVAGFARAGVHIFGPEPERCADLESQMSDTGNDLKFKALADEIWDLPNVHKDGFDMSLAGVAPDVALSGGMALADSVKFVHRRLRGAEIYWIANNSATPRALDVSFRSAGRRAEIWHPDTGLRERVQAKEQDGRSVIRLDLTRDDAQFVVLFTRRRAGSRDVEMRHKGRTVTRIIPIPGPWKVSFRSAVKTPDDITLSGDTLRTLNLNSDPDVRYFSGTATYITEFVHTISYDANEGNGRRVFLNMGKVFDMVRVILNGNDLGLLWKEPFRIDITESLKEGKNTLELHVTDSWVNRLIGDEVFPEERTTYTAIPFFDADSPLQASGLEGPVLLEIED